MATFDQLPADVQNSFLADPLRVADDFDGETFKVAQAAGHAGMWIAPELCYDFRESCYVLRTVNLTQVAQIDVGPAMATAYTKTDPNLPSWIVITGGVAGSQVYECV
jgi:hypothetical protein